MGVLALLVTVVSRWPAIAAAVLYVAVFATLTMREIRTRFFAPPEADVQGKLVNDFISVKLGTASRLTRLRRGSAAVLQIISMAVLWPVKLIGAGLTMRLVKRVLFRGQPVLDTEPDPGRALALYYGQAALNAVLFLALPASLLVFAGTGNAAGWFATALFGVLTLSILWRHLAMLIFAHDLKATFRRGLGDPRVVFAATLCIDTFTFVVLVQYLRIRTGAPLESAGFTRVLVDVLSISEVRSFVESLTRALANTGQIGRSIVATVGAVTAREAFEMICCSLLYLNVVRMVLPLRSWTQTGEDLTWLARRSLLFGFLEQARRYIRQIETKDYDVAAARIDAQISACQGDFKAAAQKLRWAHARDGLPDDPDLVFADLAGPLVVLPACRRDIGQLVTFALETNVSDDFLSGILLTIQAGRQSELGPALTVFEARLRLDHYPLSAALLAYGTGQADQARERLDAYVPKDVVSKCTVLLLREILAGPSLESSLRPSVHDAAQNMVDAVKDTAIEDLPLSRQLTLLSSLVTMRVALAALGGASPPLAALTKSISTRIEELYPSHREHASLQRAFERATVGQARRAARVRRL